MVRARLAAIFEMLSRTRSLLLNDVLDVFDDWQNELHRWFYEYFNFNALVRRIQYWYTITLWPQGWQAIVQWPM